MMNGESVTHISSTIYDLFSKAKKKNFEMKGVMMSL